MSNKRTTKWYGAAASFLLSLALLSAADATSLTRTDGTVLEGSIEHVNDNEVTLKTTDAESVSVAMSDLDASSRSTVADWASENPKFVGVYAQWDSKPTVLRSRNAVTPPQLSAPGFKGLVSLSVVLDEKGRVTWAEVSKSTHPELGDAAMDAIRSWAFKPAEVAGHAVKARIAISFKFES